MSKLDPARVKQLVTDEIFVATMQKIRQDQINQIVRSDLHDGAEREQAYMMIKAIGLLEAALQNIVDDGKVAEHKTRHDKGR